MRCRGVPRAFAARLLHSSESKRFPVSMGYLPVQHVEGECRDRVQKALVFLPLLRFSATCFTLLPFYENPVHMHTFTVLRQNLLTFTVPPPYAEGTAWAAGATTRPCAAPPMERRGSKQ